jgi:L-rhamnose mutarotase
MSRRFCFALDLVDDAALITDYETHHAPGAVWPQVVAYLRAQGAERVEIWRASDRMTMIVDASDDYPRPVTAPPDIERWEEKMWRYQRALPQAGEGEKWLPMQRIFSLDEQ